MANIYSCARCVYCDTPDVDGGTYIMKGRRVICVICLARLRAGDPPRRPHQVPPGELYDHTAAADFLEA